MPWRGHDADFSENFVEKDRTFNTEPSLLTQGMVAVVGVMGLWKEQRRLNVRRMICGRELPAGRNLSVSKNNKRDTVTIRLYTTHIRPCCAAPQ